MKRKALTVAAILVFSLLLGACQGARPQQPADNTGNTDTPSSDRPTYTPSDDVYIVPEKLANPDLVIIWDISEDQWREMKDNDPNAFNLVWSTKEAFEELYGGTVTVHGVGWGDMMNKTLEMVANGETVDLVQAHDQNFPKYAVENAVQDISKYVDLSDDFWYKSVTDAFTFGGTPYVVGADSTPVTISFNKTLFEQKGVKSPREYYEEGNWTWETFREVAMKMCEDTDGDGENDCYGFGWWDSFWVMFLNTNGVPTLSYDANGNVVSNFFTKEATECFEFLQKAYRTDNFIMPPDKGDFVQMYKDGKIAMTCEYGFTSKIGFPCDYEIDWAPLPAGPSGNKYDCGGGLQGFAIPTTSANPEGAAVFARIAYEMLTDYNQRQRIERYGLEDVELMNQLAKNLHFTPIGVDHYWDAQWAIYWGISQGLPLEEFTNNANDFFKKEETE